MNTATFTKCVHKKLINKWYYHELTHLNRKKYELLYILLRTGEWTEYNVIKKAYKKQIKIKKRQYLKSKINLAGTDQKLMWKYLKETVNMMQTNQPIRKIYINNQWMEN